MASHLADPLAYQGSRLDYAVWSPDPAVRSAAKTEARRVLRLAINTAYYALEAALNKRLPSFSAHYKYATFPAVQLLSNDNRADVRKATDALYRVVKRMDNGEF